MTDINWRPISEEPPEKKGFILYWDETSEVAEIDYGYYRGLIALCSKWITHYALINPPGGRDE